ncbi:alpha/beta fold hydrolase [Streptomyces iakyrus]|uniref:alpha/beta fold hydrolase n=1 Tax=Streptomyces iakyrus TaxID=68219 RepID=UPI0038186F79
MLLHGLARRAGEWDALATDLSPRYRVIAVDQRGHGASERRPQLVLVEAGPGRADPNLQTEIGAMLDAWLSSWAGPASCPRPRRRAMLQQRPGTVALSVPGAGHDVHLERPEVLRQVLRTFLEQVDGGRRLPPDE